MQRVACTEGLDRGNHLRDFVPMEMLITVTIETGRVLQNIACGHSGLDVGF